MTLVNSISDHLISFDAPAESGNVYPFPEPQSDQSSELAEAQQKIAELEQQLAMAAETARVEAQSEIDALVEVKDKELQAGMDELRETYEARVGELTQQLQDQVNQRNKELAERLVIWCRPVLRKLSTAHCIEDLAAVVETLLNDNASPLIKGPEHLVTLLKPHLAKLASPAWTLETGEGPEIVITSGEASIETCLEEWLTSVEDGFGG